ncbi:indolepyruvate ferredoxin oxidoreductase family protein [Oceanicoccus sagamiensis]|uniref:Indolepyruvate ferredoxin oxidoreductase n=1 Tax=Oceanicoccus sagamiensis TaxID=716816 RepID=A0A1X9NMY1_9GAMM|nr:indolepyruvate ferredoxin oxidoreductase family protein [Oceanicoccus sagamiensis]ARN75263.1 indolepyruvate ferredoxin oxidoreductase [Oceanicoccus sagamiensis]
MPDTVLTNISLDDKYTLKSKRAYMTGIEALVLLPILQHQRDVDRGLNTAAFISGYRGSPLGTVDQAMWKAQPFLDRHNITFQAGINEDLAATAVWGSQQVNIFEGAKYDGVFGMWYGKGPGLDRSMDVIKHANAAGTSKFGGVLAIAGDDHASKSSTLPHQSEHMFIGASIPVLNPANVQEVLDLGVYGWELSRFCGSWVGMKAITDNMDSAISAEVDPNRVNIVIPENFKMPEDGVHARWPDKPLAQEQRLNKYKIYAAREFARVNGLNKVVIDSDKPRLGIMTTGKAYLDVMQALEDLGINEEKARAIGLRIFKVGMSWPLEPVGTHNFAEGLEEILVVEEKRSILEDQLTSQLYNWPVERRPQVIGEFDEEGDDLLPNQSELTPAMVARVIAARLARFYQDDIIDKRLAFYLQKEQALAQPRKLLERTPHYCSGCPHSTSTRLPEGSRALGGIGCHYMGTWEKGDRRADTFTQMGGEGVSWVGQAPFTSTKHVFQNLGDGTYFHSGLLAIRQAIAAKVNVTYKILYNDAVAMTGGQSVDGPLSIDRLLLQLRGEGVQRIALVSDYPEDHKGKLEHFNGFSIDHRDDLISIEKELRDIKGTTVLIYQQTCAAEKRRRRKKGLMVDPPKRIMINPEVCEGCGDCSIQSNCLSVTPLETELGRKREIDQSACNKDYSCVKGFCPSFVSVVGGSLRKSTLAERPNNFKDLPVPVVAPIDSQPWNIIVTGIGGTGVLTIAALVAMAAHIEGKGCATMNQTGLAQKFGAVVSHVRVGKNQQAINSVRVPAGDADLLLGCDLVVSAGDEALAKVNIERSYAIINEHQSMTADFITDPDLRFTSEDMKQSIIEEVGQDEVGRDKVGFINATAIATQLFGDSIASNLFLLGYACQQGYIPVTVDALQQAITLNGVAVEFNKKAFLWGRRAAVDLEQVLDCAEIKPAFKPLEKINDIIADRYQRLTDYQNSDYADRYQLLVNKVQEAERQIIDNNDGRLAKAVAKYLYKLMAYKDEYEVARLYSNGDFQNRIKQQFEGDYHVQFHLAPPGLAKKDADTGLPLKRQFPQLLMAGFKVLAKFKFLRGTAFDVFAYSEDRQLERELLADYEALVAEIIAKLSPANYDVAIALALTPEYIRGYGHIKARHVKTLAVRKHTLLKQLRGEIIDVLAVAA